MEIPPLGKVKANHEFNCYTSDPIFVPILAGQLCKFIVEDYDKDPAKKDFETAITNFLALKRSTLTAVERPLFQYYKDTIADWEPEDAGDLSITLKEIWNHVRFGKTACVSRDTDGDQSIYISVECECDWESEHGLQLIFKNGQHITKLGPFDDHLTNAHAYARPEFADKIYITHADLS